MRDMGKKIRNRILYTTLAFLALSFFLPGTLLARKSHSFLLVPQKSKQTIYRPALSYSHPLLLAHIYKKSSAAPGTTDGRTAGDVVPAPDTFRRELSAASAIVLDQKTGQVLYAHNPNTRRQPASTIKVLTALLALQSLDDAELVPVSRHAARMPRSKIYIQPGKEYKAGELIDAVLLRSANDASVAVAEKIAGSEIAFAKKMTALAHSFGAKNTVCKTANGLTARGQYSTARDLAMIFMHAMKDHEFSQRISQKKVATSDGATLKNHNKALWQVEGATGGKTGYTQSARRTYVGSFTRDNDTLVVAFMGSDHIWRDVKKLTEYGFARKNNLRLSISARAEVPTLQPDAAKKVTHTSAAVPVLTAHRLQSSL